MAIILGRMDNQGPLPFKYYPIWDNSEEFRKLISKVWAQKVTCSPHFVWETKLKILRKEVKTWARENEKQNKKRRVELIKKMDNLQEAKENKYEDKQDYLQEMNFFGKYTEKIEKKKKRRD